jgi:hypothetical protein
LFEDAMEAVKPAASVAEKVVYRAFDYIADSGEFRKDVKSAADTVEAYVLTMGMG